MPLWLRAALLLVFVLFMVAITGAGFQSPGEQRPDPWWFAVMSLGAIVLLIVFWQFTRLQITVTRDRVRFGFGVFGKNLPRSCITGAAVQAYNWVPYGGWGIRLALGGRRAWSVPGVPMGVALDMEDKGRRRIYFVSSRNPQALLEALGAG